METTIMTTTMNEAPASSTPSTPSPVVPFFRRAGFITTAGIPAFVLLFGLFTYNKFNGIVNDGVKRETRLTAQYLDNQNELSKFISGFHEQFGIADAKAAQLDLILSDAVKGRYSEGSTAQPVGGQFISAIIESYPDLQGLSSYDRIMDYVAAGRESYKQQQTKLLDMIREYDTWRRSGILHRQLVNVAGYPSSDLRAQVGTTSVTGDAALEQMRLIVTTSDTKVAYQTGTLEPLTNKAPAPVVPVAPANG